MKFEDRTPEVKEAIRRKLHIGASAIPTPEQLCQIVNLDLSFGDIRHLHAGDFAGLRKLEMLDLESHELSSLPNGIFAGLNNLKQLYLECNMLSKLPADIFENQGKLETLRLDNNSLIEVPISVANCKQLKQLYLAHNQIKELPRGIFAQLKQLTELSLHANPLNTADNLGGNVLAVDTGGSDKYALLHFKGAYRAGCRQFTTLFEALEHWDVETHCTKRRAKLFTEAILKHADKEE